MKTAWLDQRIDYDGSQLAAHWIRQHADLVGDAGVAFVGACAVVPEHMADLEDLTAGAAIAGSEMVHFLWECFDSTELTLAVHRQRLFSAQALECLQVLHPSNDYRRSGDDLYWRERKLSISVASASPVSTLIHFAVNVSNEGTPVETACLRDLGVEPRVFADAVLARVAEEQASILMARAQVRPLQEWREGPA